MIYIDNIDKYRLLWLSSEEDGKRNDNNYDDKRYFMALLTVHYGLFNMKIFFVLLSLECTDFGIFGYFMEHICGMNVFLAAAGTRDSNNVISCTIFRDLILFMAFFLSYVYCAKYEITEKLF